MNRIQKVPIKLAKYSHRIEDRCLANHGPRTVFFDLKLQPGPAGQAHFCLQSQQVVALDFYDTPEINCISCQKPIRVTSAATHARTPKSRSKSLRIGECRIGGCKDRGRALAHQRIHETSSLKCSCQGLERGCGDGGVDD